MGIGEEVADVVEEGGADGSEVKPASLDIVLVVDGEFPGEEERLADPEGSHDSFADVVGGVGVLEGGAISSELVVADFGGVGVAGLELVGALESLLELRLPGALLAELLVISFVLLQGERVGDGDGGL